jgi:exopolyphosphatase/guanosine-5'-triphosphate,3'-diphosphate pyrophosphatase
MRIAAIDLGSNSFHMLIASVLGQSFETLLRERMTIQIGKTALLSGRLDPEAMERSMQCMQEFQRLAMARRVERTFAVATSAIREAENGEELIHQIGKTTGIAVRAISGREEARLIYLAVRQNIDFGKRKALLIDIGGGSVELTVADSSRIYFSTSQKIGFLRLHSRCVTSDPMSDRDRRLLNNLLKSTLSNSLAAIGKYGPEIVVATSGMATTLQRIVQRQQTMPGKSMIVTKDQMLSVLEIALKTKSLQRANKLDMDISRSEYFPTALLCLEAIVEGIGADEFIVSPYSLREGLVYDFIAQNHGALFSKKEENSDDLGHQAVLDLASRCAYPREHSHRVAHFADQIFQQTKDLHGLGEREARLLKHASILHDIGYHISYNKHHKHGAYLIMNCELSGFAPEEREILAQLVRYHRGAKPKPSHEPFAALPKKSQRMIKCLSAILRIADSLDRSHSQLADEVRCFRNGNVIDFRVLTRTRSLDSDLDLQSAKRKSRYFEKLYGLEARFMTVEAEPGNSAIPGKPERIVRSRSEASATVA